MTPMEENTAAGEAIKHLLAQGIEGMLEAMQALLNYVMQIERSNYLQADRYERNENRVSYANGFKPKQVETRMGTLELKVPQTRDSNFYPATLEKGMRSERALRLAVAEMYVQGVSTRKITEITEQLCGLNISSGQVSRLSAELDKTLDEWRNRPLGRYPFVFLDARYEKVRQGGSVVDCAVLMAIGVTPEGKREVLGASVELSEHEVHWRNFMLSLQQRGLHGVEMLISDAHAGLKAARRSVFPAVKWQRCQFHLQQNAQQYVPKQGIKTLVASRIRAIFNATDRTEAEHLLTKFVEEFRCQAPKLAAWAEEAIPEGFTVFELDEHLRKRLRTSNVIERLNKEVARRTKVATMFPNEASCLRLVTAVVMEISDDWITGYRWLALEQEGG